MDGIEPRSSGDRAAFKLLFGEELWVGVRGEKSDLRVDGDCAQNVRCCSNAKAHGGRHEFKFVDSNKKGRFGRFRCQKQNRVGRRFVTNCRAMMPP